METWKPGCCRPEELSQNDGLRHRVLADLNGSPVLPFRSDCFDAAVFCFGVETLRNPDAVFEEVARDLKPRAVFIYRNKEIPLS